MPVLNLTAVNVTSVPDFARVFAPRSNWSLVLAIYVRGPAGRSGYVETIASLGGAVDYSFEVDRASTEQAWAAEIDCDGEPDGLYVLACSMHGEGEDTELLVDERRQMDEIERCTIVENGDAGAIIHAWMPAFGKFVCRRCGQPGSEHTGYRLECPDRGEGER